MKLRQKPDLLIGVGVPETDGAVFRTGADDWELWVEHDARYVLVVAFQCLNTALVLVVPDFD